MPKYRDKVTGKVLDFAGEPTEEQLAAAFDGREGPEAQKGRQAQLQAANATPLKSPTSFAGGFAKHLTQEEPAALGAMGTLGAMGAGALGAPAAAVTAATSMAPMAGNLFTRLARLLGGEEQKPIGLNDALDVASGPGLTLAPKAIGALGRGIGNSTAVQKMIGAATGAGIGTAFSHPYMGAYVGKQGSGLVGKAARAFSHADEAAPGPSMSKLHDLLFGAEEVAPGGAQAGFPSKLQGPGPGGSVPAPTPHTAPTAPAPSIPKPSTPTLRRTSPLSALEDVRERGGTTSTLKPDLSANPNLKYSADVLGPDDLATSFSNPLQNPSNLSRTPSLPESGGSLPSDLAQELAERLGVWGKPGIEALKNLKP